MSNGNISDQLLYLKSTADTSHWTTTALALSSPRRSHFVLDVTSTTLSTCYGDTLSMERSIGLRPMVVRPLLAILIGQRTRVKFHSEMFFIGSAPG